MRCARRDEELVGAFVAAVTARGFDRQRALLAPTARFRSLTPAAVRETARPTEPPDQRPWHRRPARRIVVGMTASNPKRPEAKCPIRPGEPCTLCQLDVTGPQDCGLVYLVMGDDDLREGLHRNRLENAGRRTA